MGQCASRRSKPGRSKVDTGQLTVWDKYTTSTIGGDSSDSSNPVTYQDVTSAITTPPEVSPVQSVIPDVTTSDLNDACADLNADNVANLLKGGYDVNGTTSLLQTPLHYVCKTNYVDRQTEAAVVRVTEVLLDAGADVTSRDNRGWTPLRWAVRTGHPGLVRLLTTHIRGWKHGWGWIQGWRVPSVTCPLSATPVHY